MGLCESERDGQLTLSLALTLTLTLTLARGGVLIMGRASVRLEENAVYANAMAGLTVRGGARAIAERNVVSDGRSSGIYVLEQADVRLLDNQAR